MLITWIYHYTLTGWLQSQWLMFDDCTNILSVYTILKWGSLFPWKSHKYSWQSYRSPLFAESNISYECLRTKCRVFASQPEVWYFENLVIAQNCCKFEGDEPYIMIGNDNAVCAVKWNCSCFLFFFILKPWKSICWFLHLCHKDKFLHIHRVCWVKCFWLSSCRPLLLRLKPTCWGSRRSWRGKLPSWTAGSKSCRPEARQVIRDKTSPPQHSQKEDNRKTIWHVRYQRRYDTLLLTSCEKRWHQTIVQPMICAYQKPSSSL